MSSTLEVRLDDRLRVAGALLAASEWPEREQAAKAYKAHRVADSAHKHFSPHREHPAVRSALALVGGGEGLSQLYGHALNASWPASLPAKTFIAAAHLDNFWAETQADWQEAEADAREVAARADLGKFLDDLCGPPLRARKLVLVPNLLFPGQRFVVASSASEAVVCLPPPLAWGTSPPWRYKERPDEVLAKLSEAFARFLFEEAAPVELGPRAEVFALASAVLFLSQAEGDAAGDQFMVMEKKTRGLKTLPAVVAALGPILAERRAGKYSGLVDYLPQLPLQG
jgi:hypothetical protein